MNPLIEIMITQLLPALQGTGTVLYPNKGKTNNTGERHSYWELCFLSQGESVFYLDGERFELKPNTLVVLPPGSSHCEAWKESGFYRLLWLGLHPNHCNVFISERYQVREGIRAPGEAVHLSLLEQALYEFKNKDFCYREAAASYLKLFFVAIMRGLQEKAPFIPSWKE